MDVVSKVIGFSVADIVLAEFERTGIDGGPPGARIAGFEREEIAHMVARLRESSLHLPQAQEAIRIVVGTRNPQPGIPSDLILQPDSTLTHHRHSHAGGVILIQFETQEDETGLLGMYAIEDAALLGRDDDLTDTIRRILSIAWKEVDPENPLPIPEPLVDQVKEVFRRLVPYRRPPLRSWVAYCVAVAERLTRERKAMAGHEIRDAIAGELQHINLFPDSELFSKPSGLGRRLHRNHHVSDLRAPQGTTVDDDFLEEKIDETEFLDTGGAPLAPETVEPLRERMREIVQAGGPDPQHHVDLRLWEQLFENRKVTIGLGTQIRTHLEQVHGARVAELEALEIQDRLDEGDPEAARVLVEATPASEQTPLVDCLPGGIRKKLDRLAFENERGDLTDPLVAILYGLASFEVPDTSGDTPTIRLESEVSNQTAIRSLKLFAFLYNGVLRDIVEGCDGTDGGRFELDPALERIGGAEDLFLARSGGNEEEDGEEEAEKAWAPLRLKLTVSGTRTPLVRFRWDPHDVPGLVAFAWLVGMGGARNRLSIGRLDEWCDQSFDATWDPAAATDTPVRDDLVRMWNVLSNEHFREWMRAGISVEALDRFLDEWMPLLQMATDRYIPQGGPLSVLDEFLDRDTASTADGRFVMLATHPLRLRWLRHHLANLSGLIEDSLRGRLQLNPENDRLFFHWIRRVSPHRQPPVLSPGGKVIATAVREVQLHEEFAAAPTGEDDSQDWLGALDDVSIDEFVATTKKFLDAFPWKTGGLSVLLLATSGAAATARKYVERLRQRELAGLDLELHVATTLADHDSVANALSILDTDEGRGRVLFPQFRLVLHQWEGGDVGDLGRLDGRIDVALAPNLFGLHSTVLEETRHGSGSVGGRFDPWLDPATHFRPSDGKTINVSQVLLPPTPDPLLEQWSTLSVRRRRQAPVDAGDPSGTDFITLQVAFDKHEGLFMRLHEIAHWVVTLDPFVGRDQIDALSNAPDVIVVKPGVGKNEGNTLLVSSAAGKDWVTRQLAKRLVADFGFEEPRSLGVAKRLYEIGRNVAPGLMLRALGLGRSTEEILGLILARYGLDHFFPEGECASGVEYWLCLDEYPNWFGGALSTRPDLLRVRLTRVESQTCLDLLVLESKFRRQVDHMAERRAEEQVMLGKRLFDSALLTGDRPPDDAKFWRRELLTAVAQSSRRPPSASDLASRRCFGTAPDEDALLDDLRSGNFTFTETRAVVSLTSWAGTAPADQVAPPPVGFQIHRLWRETVMDLLQRIEAGLAPTEQSSGAPPATGFEPLEGTVPAVTAAEVIAEPPPSSAESTTERDQPTPSSPEPGPVEPPPILPTPPAAEPPSPEQRGISAQELEIRYGKLLGRLDQLKVDVRRPATGTWQQGPGFCLYRVVPSPGVPVDRITGKMDDIKLALELPAELSIRTYVDRGAVIFEVPKEDKDRYFVSAKSLWERSVDDADALSVPIGEDIQGDVVEIDFSSSDTPHLLIAGQTGAGKSVALETILEGMCRRKSAEELRLLLVDPKGTELTAFEGRPHTEGTIGWQPEDALEILHRGIEEMERRYATFKAALVRSLPDYNRKVEPQDRLPWWMIVLDEYADLTSDPDDRKAIETALKRLAQKGRAAGIHLIVATQKPSAEVISTVIRSNLPAQLALRVKSSIDSRIILEEAGAESLAGKGDAFLRTTKGLRRVQCGRADG